MIDNWDIRKIKKWLRLAKTRGTDAIKIVVGDKPDTWIVTEVDKKNE